MARVRRTGIGAIRSAEVDRALKLCGGGIEAGHGAIVFLAGPPASGRSGLLAQLDLELRYEAARLRTVRGTVADGRYLPEQETRDGQQALALAQGALGLAGAALPILGLVGQVMSVSRTALALVEEGRLGSGEPTFDALFQLLRVAAREKPIVCLVDDCDEADGRWWSELLLGLAAEIERDLPLFLFLAVEGGAEPGANSDDEPDAMFAARHLTGRGLAQWWPLGDATPDDLRVLTGAAEPDTTARLGELTDGRVGWAAELWAEWRTLGVVERDTDLGPWRFAPGQPDRTASSIAAVVRRRLGQEFGDDSDGARLAWDVLACAALEGRYFTGQVVAAALGLDSDAVVDLIDDRLLRDEHRPHGLVEEAGWLTVEDAPGEERHLARYRFASGLLRSALVRYGLGQSEREARARGVADAIERVLGSAATALSGRMAALMSIAGDAELAAEWRRRADGHMPADAIAEQARALFELEPESTDRATCRRACHILLQASFSYWAAGALNDVRTAGQRAAILARHEGDEHAEAAALDTQGAAESYMGMPDEARTHLDAAAALFRAHGDRRGIAAVALNQAYLEGNTGALDQARAHFDEAIALFHGLGDAHGEMNARMVKANLLIQHRDPDGAAAALAPAIPLVEAYGDLSDQAKLREALGGAAYHARRFDQAIAYYREANQLYQEGGYPRGMATSLRSYGISLASDGQWEEAESVLREVIVEAQAMENASGETEARAGLAHVLGATGRAEAAIEEQRLVLELLRGSGMEHLRADRRVDLAKLMLAGGDVDGARAELEGALEDARRAGAEPVVATATELLDSLP
ncbi:MAG TPA: tetratricopeptide repeat protein [Thermoleophilaceae bacterium]